MREFRQSSKKYNITRHTQWDKTAAEILCAQSKTPIQILCEILKSQFMLRGACEGEYRPDLQITESANMGSADMVVPL